MHKYIFYVHNFRFHFKNSCLILFYIKANCVSRKWYKVCQCFIIKVTSEKLYVDVKIKMFLPLLFFLYSFGWHPKLDNCRWDWWKLIYTFHGLKPDSNYKDSIINEYTEKIWNLQFFQHCPNPKWVHCIHPSETCTSTAQIAGCTSKTETIFKINHSRKVNFFSIHNIRCDGCV